MICPNCQKEIDNDSRFCRHCGVEFLDDPETEIEISPDEDYPSDNVAEVIDTLIPETVPPKNPKNKKTLRLQIVVCLSVLLVFCGIFAIVAATTDVFSFGKEPVTDAEGEKVRPGIGTTEMSIVDTDGTVRTIITDRSLLTPDKILSEYTVVMNQLKTDAPAFTFTRYQNLPTDYQNVGPAASFVLPIIERYVTSKTASDEIAYTSGNADKLPLPDSSYGCLLTDSTKIKNAYCEVIDRNNYKIVITLTDELNPQINSAGATSSVSAITAMFDPYDAATQITAISELAFNKIDFNYTGCTVTLLYNHDTMKVQSINMLMNIDITANTLLGKINARIVDICEYTQITY